jgi:hypothetical protein
MSAHIDELMIREITSRMGGHRLQQRFIELVWSSDRHLFIKSKLPGIMDTLDGMSASDLISLVNLLERPGYSNNVVASTAFMIAVKDSGSYSLSRWTRLMEAHFEKMKSTYLDSDLLSNDNMLEIVERITRYYRDGLLTFLTAEQEWAVIAVSAATFHNGVFFRAHQTSAKSHLIVSKPLMDYVTGNVDRNDEITKAIAEERLTEPAQIDAYLAGNRTALLEGAL